MRNYVTSQSEFILDRYFGGPKDGDFEKTIKPFITNKGTI